MNNHFAQLHHDQLAPKRRNSITPVNRNVVVSFVMRVCFIYMGVNVTVLTNHCAGLPLDENYFMLNCLIMSANLADSDLKSIGFALMTWYRTL